ncbi:MAG: type II toxin-antitoxin system PrlF family antitoxin [Candidatus Competibacteraceae bacterium]
MNLLVSKVTQKYQATIPAEVRRVLGIGRGDSLAFAIEDGKVLLRRATPLDREFANALQSTLEEWSSPHDEAAYRDL